VASRAAAALVIRRAVAPLLLDRLVDSAAWARAAAVDRESCRLFLRVERCALPLARALAARPGLLDAAAPLYAVLEAAARREAARALVARTQLRTAACAAGSAGLDVIVLKGGVLVAGDEPIDVADIDVLVDIDRADAFAAVMQRAGFRSSGQRSDRVALSLAADGGTIEVHIVLGGDKEGDTDSIRRRSVLLDEVPPLRRLAPLDHLRHVVQHTTVDHLNRRTRIRDLLLIAHAARSCSPAEVASAYPSTDTSYRTAVCRATLERALRAAPEDAGRGEERGALTAYVLASTPPLRFLPQEVTAFVGHWSVSMLQTKWERQHIWESARHASLGPSSRPYIRAVEQRSAVVGRAWRVAARTAYRAATWIVARPIAARTRRTVEQALASPVLLRS
jgi:hypothetical protein